MTNPHLRLVAPSTVNCTVTRRRPPNAELRTREHLTPDEVERLIEAAKTNRHGRPEAPLAHRDCRGLKIRRGREGPFFIESCQSFLI